MEDNNNLEKFFRDKFNQRIEPQDWNIPDNEVWDSIASEINKEDKRRRVGILPIILVGSSILLSLFMGIDNYNKGKSIVALEQELKDCAHQSDLTAKEADRTEERPIAKEIVSSEQNFHLSQPNNVFKHKSLGQNNGRESIGKSNKPTTNLITNNNSVESLEGTEVNQIGVKNSSSNNSDNESATPILLPLFPMLPILDYGVLKSQKVEKIADLPFVTESIIPKKETNGAFAFGAVAQYIHWQDKVKGSFNNPLEGLLVKEVTSPSLALGLAINKKINNHLVLNTGLMYYERNQTSKYEINLPYSTVDEINVGSEFENKFSHSLPTGLGNVNTNLVLSRSISSPVTNNENVYLDFSLQNHTKALTLPLTLSYYINKSGEGFYVQGGLFNEFIIQNEIREVNTESHHTFVKDKSISVDYNKSQINKVNTSALIGIGYEKEILKGIGISLSTNYGFALTNTFATPSYQHKIDQLGLQVMVMKNLK
ncbi:MAG TPA: outer membrane beta-barrel protein [Saprospiraceae bacterium]|nr:outer membrane beta-barrel protein [Saprospiraceae bacterium]